MENLYCPLCGYAFLLTRYANKDGKVVLEYTQQCNCITEATYAKRNEDRAYHDILKAGFDKLYSQNKNANSSKKIKKLSGRLKPFETEEKVNEIIDILNNELIK